MSRLRVGGHIIGTRAGGNLRHYGTSATYVPPTNVVPVASFTQTTTGLTVNVTSTSTDSDGTIVSYAWAWGDTATSTGATATHTYSTAGSYTITLTVTDERGGTGTATVTVNPAVTFPTISDPYTFTTSTGQAARIDFPTGWTNTTAVPLVIQARGVDFDITGNTFQEPTMTTAAIGAGWAVATCAFHGNSYGSPAAMADLTALVAEARRVATIGPVVLWGNSMGGALVLNAVTTGTLVPAGVYLTDAVVDLRQRYDNGRAATIQAAYGIASDGSDYATKTAGYDPALRAAADFGPSTLRYREVASTADTQVDLDLHGYLVEAKIGSPRFNSRDIGDTGHNTAARFIPSDFTAFLTSVLTPDSTAPTAPVLTGTAGDTTVALSWTAGTDTVGTVRYRVKRGTTVLTPIAITGTSYTDTGRTNGTAYSYTVEAINAQGLVTASNSVTVTPTATVVFPSDTFEVAGDLGGAALPVGGGTWSLILSNSGTTPAASELVKTGGMIRTKAGGVLSSATPFASTPMFSTTYRVETVLTAIDATAAARGGGPAVRISGGAGFFFNTRVNSTTQGYALYKQPAGSASTITTVQSTTVIPTIGDVIWIDVTPTTIACYVNGALIGTLTDSLNGTIGNAGFFFNATSTGTGFGYLTRTA